MLSRQLVPLKFLSLSIEIIICSVLLATNSVYPTLSNTSSSSFIAGCILIIIFAILQIAFTFVGINTFNNRIQFENLLLNFLGGTLLIWFALALWPREYIWYIWGFLCIYPICSQLSGLISTMLHSKKILFEKYRPEQ